MSAFEQRLIAETRARLVELEQEAERLRAALAILDVPAAPAPEEPKRTRVVLRDTRLTEAEVRDWVVARGEPFSSGEAAAALRVSTPTVVRVLKRFAERTPPLVEASGQTTARRWRYIPPAENTNGPTVAPRGGERLHLPGGIPRGTPLPFTGQIRGPSGRPGLDRKAQARGHRIKRQRNGT